MSESTDRVEITITLDRRLHEAAPPGRRTSCQSASNIDPGSNCNVAPLLPSSLRLLAGWPAAGSVDGELGKSLSFLEGNRAQIAERRVPASGIAEPLDVIEHVSPRGIQIFAGIVLANTGEAGCWEAERLRSGKGGDSSGWS
ncbi:MAG: hypothetical protein R3D31_08150 [Hyphomicrobiaceae bacterium]